MLVMHRIPLKLKQSNYIKGVDWSDIETIAAGSYDVKSYLQTEFLTLLEKAKKNYSQKKRKRKNEY